MAGHEQWHSLTSWHVFDAYQVAPQSPVDWLSLVEAN